jgi:SHS2 domain-containing protein
MGIRGIGRSREQAFEQTALAMTAVITDPTLVRATEAVEIRCDAPDDELLLVDWLNALIGEMGIRKVLFSRFEVHLEGSGLRGTAWGETADPARHHPAVEVKGATYTALKVREDPPGTWVAQCVVDV